MSGQESLQGDTPPSFPCYDTELSPELPNSSTTVPSDDDSGDAMAQDSIESAGLAAIPDDEMHESPPDNPPPVGGGAVEGNHLWGGAAPAPIHHAAAAGKNHPTPRVSSIMAALR